MMRCGAPRPARGPQSSRRRRWGQAAAGAARWMRPRRPPSPTVSSAGPSRDGAEGRGRAGGGGSPEGGPTSLLLGRVSPLGTPPGRDGSEDGTGASAVAAPCPWCCPSAAPAEPLGFPISGFPEGEQRRIGDSYTFRAVGIVSMWL